MKEMKTNIDYTNTPKVLEVNNLRVNFKSDSGLVYAVRGVSFDLYKGETLCIVGESGSGKSVTSKTIMGILANNAIIESGQILYEGEDLVRISEEEFHRIRGNKIGMIFQDPLSSLNPIVKIGKQITEATLINKNILKKHYSDLISKQLVALRNNDANKIYEFNKISNEIEKIDSYIKDLNDKKNPVSLEKRSEIDEFIHLFKKENDDNLSKLHEDVRLANEEDTFENKYQEVLIKEKKLNLLVLKEEIFNKFKVVVENIPVDQIEALNKRKEYLAEFKKYIDRENKELKPLYKKALASRKKDAAVENKKYAAELKETADKKLSELQVELDKVNSLISNILPSLSEEEKKNYDEILARIEPKKVNPIVKFFKKEKQEEINISKISKKDEIVTKTGNEKMDKLLSKKEEIETKIEEVKDEYINSTKVTKKEARKMALQVMKEVGIPLPEKRFKQYPFEFSGGMRQRIVIAIALTANPDILICDEPTTALDVTIQAQILELINKLKRERGLSCIFITHDLGVVANMADRVAVMYAGKIVEYGTSYEIFYNPKHPYTWALLSSIPDLDSKEKLEAIPGTPPDMRFPPKGDAFALRSKYALDIDFKYEPPYFKVSDTHYAATWLLHEDAPKVDMPKIVKTRIANSIKAYEDGNHDDNQLKSLPEESFNFVEEVMNANAKEALMKTSMKAYQDYESGNISVSKDTLNTEVHNSDFKDELEFIDQDNVEDEISNIKSKCKFKEEYAEEKTILSVNHLKQYFFFGKGPNRYKLKAVHDVSFKVKEGECFGIVGESGCGKTTTGRSIIRLYHITSGSIYYKGYRIGAGSRWNEKEIKYTKIRYNALEKELKAKLAKNEITKEEFATKLEEAREHKNNIVSVQKAKINQIKHDDKHVNKKLLSEIQMIFQDPIDSLDPRMTVEDIIQEGLIIQGHKNRAENHKKVVQVLEKVGLIADYCNRYPHEFSGGQRQRIGIARALVMNPKLLICDEPISALDVSIRAQIINLLNDLKEEMGLTIMFIAHDLSVVKYFCDRIAVMYFGEIVELATSDELFRHPLHPYTKSLLSAIPKPNPLTEKDRIRIPYNPREAHDYSVDKPSFVEIEPGHFVLANKAEVEKYKAEMVELDKKAEEEKEELFKGDKTINEVTEEAKVEEVVNEEKISAKEVAEEKTVDEPTVDEKTSESTEEKASEETPENVTQETSKEEPKKSIEEVAEEKEETQDSASKKEPSETLLKQRSGEIKKVYHLKKVDGRWELILKEGMKVIKTFPTKQEALVYSKKLVESQNGTLLVHASKGKNKGKFIKE